MNGFRKAVEGQGPNVGRVARFEQRDAIVVTPEVPGDNLTQTELNKHPGVVAFEDSADPTLRAIFLASFERKLYKRGKISLLLHPFLSPPLSFPQGTLASMLRWPKAPSLPRTLTQPTLAWRPVTLCLPCLVASS